uniref:Liver-expressed antimicrobial peptide 2 n=1 Tax=Naja naja TaxID=35670 RepID=A0A8C6XR26_NAJNA
NWHLNFKMVRQMYFNIYFMPMSIIRRDSMPKRMTPFWRGLSRPVGAPCRDNSECFTGECRNKLCCLKKLQE